MKLTAVLYRSEDIALLDKLVADFKPMPATVDDVVSGMVQSVRRVGYNLLATVDMDEPEPARSESYWCEACNSYHVDPVDIVHWQVLQCRRPWSEWRSS